MTISITDNYISQFSSNLHMLLDQKESHLKMLFPTELANGEKHFFDRLGNFTASPVLNRLENTVIQDAAHSRRMATVIRYAANCSLDDIDKFKLLIDPTNDYVRKLANAHGKNIDQVILTALLGAAASGVSGASSTNFDSNNTIAAASGGLTVAKFNKAIRLLQAAEVDMDSDRIYCITNSRGFEGLMNDTTFTSGFYRDSKPLEGSNERLMFRQVQIIHSERVPEVTAGTAGRAIFCTENAVRVAMAKDFEIQTAPLPSQNFAQLIATYMFFGAVRMEEGLVVDLNFTY